jgi:uncharacterized protein YjiS (DUF1127 family)
MQHCPCLGAGLSPIFRHVESDGNRAVADNRMSEIMYRMTLNQNVALDRAFSPFTTTRETGLAAAARFGRVLVNSVRSYLKRTAIETELSRLDGRMLADIGLTRSQIGSVAAAAVDVSADGSLFAEFSRMVVNAIVRPVVDWNRRRHVYDTLMAMDERMLSDIGLARYEVAEYVRKLGTKGVQPLPETLAAMEQDVTAPIRAWSRARLTAKQLSRLSDRQLLDIGVVRGDIDELAQDVARKATLAANVNHAPKAA